MDRIGYVYFRGIYAGELQESEIGYKYICNASYLETGVPIGFNFPLSQAVYFNEELFPFFENLICEGWLLKLQSSIQYIDPSDKFGILIRNGKNLTGARALFFTSLST
ncbi:MAG: HipA N-terminal domain-containing protein [Spirochaetales bacterium]|nr:HipA N-terminal domain-containing protein [Spirochaetales bacterium]